MVDDSPTLTNAPRDQPASTRWLNPNALTAPVSAHLDVIRSVAAWAVMWGHLRALFFIDYQELSPRSPLLRAVYFVTGFGHEAVMVFFVLSGFLISLSILRSQVSGTWSWASYAISRSTRLYVVLIPGLLFGALWDFTGKFLFAASHLYSSPLANFTGLIVQNELNAKNFFGNLLFLQTIFCKTFGSNGPLWSIANEFWYYVLFPLGLIASQSWLRKARGQAVVLALVALSIAAMLGPEKMAGFLIWLAGFALVIACARIRISTRTGQLAYLSLSGSILGVCLIAARFERLGGLVSDLAVGLAFSAFLFAVLQLDFSVIRDGVYLRGARLFAGFSYSLYVLHFPFLLFLRAWLVPAQRWQPDSKHLFYGVGIGTIVLVFAWLVAGVTEFRTREAREGLRKLLLISN
jgi:peptidoglycan/LPS O-acetylase OafA/YrhL